MQKELTQIAAMNKRGMELAMGAWEVAFSGIEKWSRLNIEASKALLAEAADQAKSVSSIKSVDELASYGRNAGTVGIDRALGYTRHCQQISTESQAEVAHWMKSTSEEIKSDVTKAFSDLGLQSPQPSKDAAAAAMQGATAWSDSVIETAQRVVKQANEFTDAAINAASDAVKNTRVKKDVA
jgi:phasin family protein